MKWTKDKPTKPGWEAGEGFEAFRPVSERGKIIEYTHGHKCVPNGANDYTFLCPTYGAKPGFIPFMMRGLMSGKCRCGQEVEAVEEE